MILFVRDHEVQLAVPLSHSLERQPVFSSSIHRIKTDDQSCGREDNQDERDDDQQDKHDRASARYGRNIN